MTNKVVKIENGVTSVLLDVSQTTATEADVASGKIFTKQDGTQGTGILEPVVEEIVGYEKTVSGTQVTFEKKGTTPEGETINATTDEEIAELLVSENIGKVLRFNGSSDTYVDGGYYLIESAVSLISFTIGDASYQAVDGMTWGEWVESGYNPGGYSVSGSNIVAPSDFVIYDNNYVLSNELIVEGRAYSTGYFGGGTND